MPVLPTRRQQPNPVTPQVPIPSDFPAIPQEVLDRFPSAKDWQTKLNEFWGRTNQALQEAQRQTAAQVNSQVIWTVDRFLIYTNSGGTMPMFALDDTGVRLGNVLVINTPGRKVYIGRGEYQDAQTPFYIDTLGRFSLGANLAWDPDTSTLAITGIITATSGTIGGFDIGADYIRDTGNSFGLASTVAFGPDVRMWSGDTFANRATAPFRILENGDIYANTINAGTITATGVVGIGSSSNSVVLNVGKSISPAGTGASGIAVNGGLTCGVINGRLAGIDASSTFHGGGYAGVSGYGLIIDNVLGSGALANYYSIYLYNGPAATNRYAIYSASTALSYFTGDIYAVSIGATTPSTGAFTTLSATTSLRLSAANPYIEASDSGAGNPGFKMLDGNTAKARIDWIRAADYIRVYLDSTGEIGEFSSAGLAVTGVVDINGAAASATASHLQIGSSTQSTIGANGAASALTANPLGYISAYLGTTHIIIPYYNA